MYIRNPRKREAAQEEPLDEEPLSDAESAEADQLHNEAESHLDPTTADAVVLPVSSYSKRVVAAVVRRIHQRGGHAQVEDTNNLHIQMPGTIHE